MSDTDIYKNGERVQQAPTGDPRSRKGRRRSSSCRLFDDHNRKRRNKNSGLRRLLHLSRKSKNEKHLWWGMLVFVVVLLSAIAIWQFWYLEHVARKQLQQDELYIPIQPSGSSTQ
jgi:hypothetical protein